MADLQALADAIIRGDQSTAVEVTTAAIKEGMGPKTVLDDGLIAGMDVIGGRFKRNEVYIPEVLISARAMKSAMAILEPELARAGIEPVGKFMIGTVAGDLHDIGKNLVAMMLKGAGFEVVDIGIDVPAETFVEKAKESGCQIIGMSTFDNDNAGDGAGDQDGQDAGIEAKIIIGGAPITPTYAEKVGADGYSADAASAVDIIKGLLGIN